MTAINSPKPLTVLLVEDLSDDVFFFKHALKRAGLTPDLHLASDGLQAVEYLSNQGPFSDPAACPRPDIIFLDLKMPNMNGFEVLEWMQQQAFNPPIRVVVLTGSEEPGDIARARGFGVEEYLIKPPSAQKLIAMLSRVQPATGLSAPSVVPEARATPPTPPAN